MRCTKAINIIVSDYIQVLCTYNVYSYNVEGTKRLGLYYESLDMIMSCKCQKNIFIPRMYKEVAESHVTNIFPILITEYLCFRLKVPLGCTTELSHKGQEFLTLLFMQHDRDRDGALSPLEMDSLFSRCLVAPWGDEYKYTVPTNEKVYLRFYYSYKNIKLSCKMLRR